MTKRLLGDPEPVLDDWKSIFEPVNYSFQDGWHFRAVTGLLVLVIGLAVLGFARLDVAIGWKVVVAILFVAGGVLTVLPLDREGVVIAVAFFSLLPLCVPLSVLIAWSERGDRKRGTLKNEVGLTVCFWMFVAGLAGVPLALYAARLSHAFLANYISSAAAIIVLLAIVALGILLVIRGNQRARAARNPLRGLLEEKAERTDSVLFRNSALKLR